MMNDFFYVGVMFSGAKGYGMQSQEFLFIYLSIYLLFIYLTSLWV